MEQQAAAAAAAATCPHRAIRRAIRDYDLHYHTGGLSIHQDDTERADQQSVEYLVNHLRSHAVRDLSLFRVRFSDEGFAVLLAYLAGNTTAPLTTFKILCCDFDRPDRSSQLLAAIRTNTSVTDLAISYPRYQGEMIDNVILDSDIITGLLEKNNPPLQKLRLQGFALRLGDADALRRALGNIPHLTELRLDYCDIDDAAFQVITDGLAGNTTLDVLDICGNTPITSTAFLSNITRILESMQLKELKCGSSSVTLNRPFNLTNDIADTVQERFSHVLSNNTFITSLDMENVSVPSSVAGAIFQALGHNTTLENLTLGRVQQGDMQLVMESLPAMRGLKRLTLSLHRAWIPLIHNPSLVPSLHKNTSLEEFARLDVERYPQHRDEIVKIDNILSRNCGMRRARSLLALQPRTGLPTSIGSKSGIWYMAMAKLGPASDRLSGASAIFHILRTRPALFEKQLKRPSSSTQQGSASTHHRRVRPRAVAQQEPDQQL